MKRRPILFSRGFTLIELLVVIAIIGMLSSVVLASLNSARTRSRDARRVQDLTQIRNAIELYADTNKHYPNSNGAWTSFDSPSYSPNPIITPNAANLTAALQPYLSGTPGDPRNLGADSGYLYFGDNNNYCILIYRTVENLNNVSAQLIPATRCTAWDSAGQCTGGGTNTIYYGVGTFAAGC